MSHQNPESNLCCSNGDCAAVLIAVRRQVEAQFVDHKGRYAIL